MSSAEKQLGGGEGEPVGKDSGGTYGTATANATLEILRTWPNFTSESVVLDIGSGLSRFLMHASFYPEGDAGPKRTIGIECDPVKCKKAIALVEKVKVSCHFMSQKKSAKCLM